MQNFHTPLPSPQSGISVLASEGSIWSKLSFLPYRHPQIGCHASCLVFGLWLLLPVPVIRGISVTIWWLAAKLSVVGESPVITIKYFRLSFLHHPRGHGCCISLPCQSWLGKKCPLTALGSLLRKWAVLLHLHQGALHSTGNDGMNSFFRALFRKRVCLFFSQISAYFWGFYHSLTLWN